MRPLTDSYCERCGTRYTFGPSPTRGPSLAGARVLARGLKNFVMTDGTTLDEALAAARIDDTRDVAIRVTEEFHRTFNFCMSCRQYACDKCWNENQGACLSCAPLWDEEPVAPEGLMILRNPAGKPAEIDFRRRADGSGESIPWPSADPLSLQSTSAPATYGPSPEPSSAGFRPTPALHPRPPVPLEPFPRSDAFPTAQPGIRLRQARPLPEPPRSSEPLPIQALPSEPVPSEPNPQQAHGRRSSRASEDERAAAEMLRAQAQSWKERDDGWTLWPTGDEHEAGLTLTAEELQIVQAKLGHTAQPEDEGPAVISAVDREAISFSPSHTLDEDAALIGADASAHRSDPPAPVAATWEPEAPAPRKEPPRDFDLLGSLRAAIKLSHDQAAASAAPAPVPAAPAEPRSTPIRDRLLGHGNPMAPLQPGPIAPEPAEAARPVDGQASPWPVATPWGERSAEGHGSPAPEATEAMAGAAPEPAPEPRQEQPAAEPEPQLATEPLLPAETTQQPLFTLPPATAERWPKVPLQAAVRPAAPQPRPAIEWPVNDPLDPAAQAPSPETPSAWPPIGSSWPVQEKSATPWAVPADAFAPAPYAAGRGPESAETAESPLVAALWAESTQQVLDQGSVRVCPRCALPVSTHARFCRRCGTAQT
jgi:hypothetical protein